MSLLYSVVFPIRVICDETDQCVAATFVHHSRLEATAPFRRRCWALMPPLSPLHHASQLYAAPHHVQPSLQRVPLSIKEMKTQQGELFQRIVKMQKDMEAMRTVQKEEWLTTESQIDQMFGLL